MSERSERGPSGPAAGQERAALRGRVVVGVDGSEPSAAALRWAAREAGLRGAVLDVVMAWRAHYPFGIVDPGVSAAAPLVDVELETEARTAEMVDALGRSHAEETLAGMIAGLAPDQGALVVKTRAVRGHPSEVLVDAAAGAALLVVGTRGRGGFRGLLLGSVSFQVATHSRTPVVVVPGDWP